VSEDSGIEALVADAARAFAERHREALDAGERLRAIPASVFQGCAALGWLGELSDEIEPSGGEARERHPFAVSLGSRLLASLVYELARISPALGTRLLCHHFARQWIRPFCGDAGEPHVLGEAAPSPWLSVAPFAPLPARSAFATSNVNRNDERDVTLAMVLANPVEARVIAALQISPDRAALVQLSLADAARICPVETLGLAGLGVADVKGWRTTSPMKGVLSEQGDAIARSAREALHYVFPAYLALARAILRAAEEGARTHASIRHQGGGRLLALAPIQERLSTLTASGTTILALEARGAFSHDEIDALLPQIRVMLLKGTDASLQIFGGAGYVVGTGQERLWRDARQVACLFGSRLGKLG
jgi:alkylation response protein AidB-like acyl-CoA dehydrogenase